MNEQDARLLAQQLGCPDGEHGVKTGENMNITNANMISSTITASDLQSGDLVLEIGPGNAGHLSEVLGKGDHIIYTGVDISETMLDEANRINKTYVNEGIATFLKTDGEKLEFENDTFDKTFTVNTLYFWSNPPGFAGEIYRVLKPGGRFYLSFAQKNFMKSLPFTAYGFELYGPEEAANLLNAAGFIVTGTQIIKEKVKSNTGDFVEREFVIMTGTKPTE